MVDLLDFWGLSLAQFALWEESWWKGGGHCPPGRPQWQKCEHHVE